MIYRKDDRVREPVTLEESISIPSDIHSYCMGVEYMRDWFLSKFKTPDGTKFFKTVYVQGRNILDDFRRFNREKILVVEKPALSITPVIDYDFDRETVDLDLGGLDVLSRRSSVYKEAFFQDVDNNIFLGITLKQIQMKFTFRVRVNTRAEQLDLANYIKKRCRIKATQYEYITMDYHIPLNIILSIAKLRGFEIVDDKIVDIVGFLSYMNAHSFLPVVYKYRTINGRREFFLKMPKNYMHIACPDQLQLDEGNMVNQLMTNYHIEFDAILKMPSPNLYYYFSKDLIPTTYEKVTSTMEALYTYKSIEPPTKNDKGWDQYLSTEWEDDTRELTTIPFEELLQGGRLIEVIKHTMAIGLSPAVFFDVELYNGLTKIPTKIDWEKIELVINKKVISDTTKITIYIDKEFFNDQVMNIDGDRGRLAKDTTGTV